MAGLDSSPLTDQEPLRAIATIAAWVREEASADGAPCRETVRTLNTLTRSKDFEALRDWAAMEVFGAVLETLHVSDATVRPAAA